MYKTIGSLILASSSPRRRELLSRLGLTFTILPSGIEESEALPGSPEIIAQEWARRKAQAVAGWMGADEDHWYLGVDTMVVVDGDILGKPASREQAEEFLRRLSGRWHQVVSGYCLVHPPTRRQVQNLVSSRVLIAALEPDELSAYLDTEEPYDKAGAYAVQGIGAFMVAEIDGSYTNVVGLPLTELVADLRRLGVIETRKART
jgi:septum formation protein